MKQITAALMVVIFLCSCSKENRELEKALALRQSLLSASECRFEAEITADYGDKQFQFSSVCSSNSDGEVSFTVTAPKNLESISGKISETGGLLTFDDTALNFPLMADDLLSPVSAPWILMKTLRGGYLKSAGEDDNMLHLTIDDTYQEDALQLDIWIDEENKPIRADILHNGCRILCIEVTNFQIL